MADTRVLRSSSPSPAAAPVNTAVHASGSSGWLTPERVAHAEFRSSFRGLDGAEVRSFLARVAAELRGLLEREGDLLTRLEAAEARQVLTAAEPLDMQQVSDLLGQETARVLSLAREAAADIKSRAESDAAALTATSVAESERLRAESEGLVAERRSEADAAAADILSRAEAAAEQLRAEAASDAEGLRAEADSYAETVRADAEAVSGELRDSARSQAEVVRAEAAAAADKLRAETAAGVEAALTRAKESAAAINTAAESRSDELVSAAVAERDAAREEGKRMIGEARAVRERILGDMARRRNAARQQLERVRAARERLLDAVESVRQGVTDVQAELAGSLVDAKLAGDRAARAVDVNEVPSLRELEAEVRLARDTGLIDDQSIRAAASAPVNAVEAGTAVDLETLEPGSAPAETSDSDSDPVTSNDPIGVAQSVGGAEGSELLEGSDEPASKQWPFLRSLPSKVADVGVPTEDADAHEQGMIIDLRDRMVARPEHADGHMAGDDPYEAAPTDDDPESDGLHSGTRDEAQAEGTHAEGAQTERADLNDGVAQRDGGYDSGTDSGTRPGPVVPRRGSRRERSTRRTEDLFARLRAADDVGSSRVRNGSGGVGALIGLAQEPTLVTPDDPIEEVTVLVSLSTAEESPVPHEQDELVDLDPDRVALHTRDAVLAGPMRDLLRQLKLALSDQQNEMLQAQSHPELKRGFGTETSAPTPTFEQIVTALEEASAAELMVGWSLGRRSVRQEDEVQAGRADVAGEVSALASRIVTLLQERLGEPEDEGVAWDVDRVRSAYREVRSQRLGELVEFNLYSAYAAGQLAAAGSTQHARWVSDACGPDCMDNALAEDINFGEPFPTGHLAPPSFPGCRCCLVPAD